MIDINVLRLMRTRVDYSKIMSQMSISALSADTQAVAKAIGKYYDAHKTHNTLDPTAFIPYMERNVYPKVTDTKKQIYRKIAVNMMKTYPDDDSRRAILSGINDLDSVHKLAQVVEEYNSGNEVNVLEELETILNSNKVKSNFITKETTNTEIVDSLDTLDNEEGVLWGLPCLDRSLRRLRSGDSVILGARPDQGKTSLLCHILTSIAPQLPEGRPIMWVNNEGMRENIFPRLMSAALNADTEELLAKKAAGTLHAEYTAAMGGDKRIHIMNAQGWNVHKVKEAIEEFTPAIVVYDMLDNVNGFGSESRQDLVLERLYQWAREQCVIYDHAMIATSQISSEGADKNYPGYSMLKDSKTGKQGACDLILMMGSQENIIEQAEQRWIHAPKNKMQRFGGPKLMEQLTFDKTRARFNEIKVEE